MSARELPWKLLLTALQRSDRARVSYGQVADATSDVAWLVREKVLVHSKDDYEPPGCEHGCQPNFDYASRHGEGLVGIACPHEPACWPGWEWVPLAEVQALRTSAPGILAALAKRNGLRPLSREVPEPFLPVGVLNRRGLAIAVVWNRSLRRGFEQLCRGVREELGSDALIVLSARPAREALPASLRTAVVAIGADADGRIDFSSALDDLVPDYRERAVDDPELDLDFVQLRFSTVPGERHRLEINGHDFGGLRKSDLQFLRLLLLACARLRGDDDGWVDRERLRVANKKAQELDELRKEFGKLEVPGLAEEERRALIKSRKGTGAVRLAVPPENIILDPSLADLTWMTPTTTRKRSGASGKVSDDQLAGMQKAATLLRECRRLGAPGDAEAVKTPGRDARRP